jgi:hypothetical protein
VMARPEVRDGRPGWGNGRPNATSVLLSTGRGGSGRPAASPAGHGAARHGHRRAHPRAADGSPLFVVEVVAMLIDDGVLPGATAGPTTRGDRPRSGAARSAADRLSVRERAVIGPRRSRATSSRDRPWPRSSAAPANPSTPSWRHWSARTSSGPGDRQRPSASTTSSHDAAYDGMAGAARRSARRFTDWLQAHAAVADAARLPPGARRRAQARAR